MSYQIEIEYEGTYKLDDGCTVVNPLVTATGALDDFIENVIVTCLFSAPTYSYSRVIGTFTYSITWGNLQVEAFMNDYMANHKI